MGRVKGADRDAAFRLLETGVAPVEVASRFGVSVKTAERWLKQISEDGKDEEVQVQPDAPTAEVPESMSAFERARAAAGLPPSKVDRVADSGPGIGPVPTESNPMPPVVAPTLPSEKALVGVLEVMTQVACRIQAVGLKVPWAGELRKACKMTKDERADLEAFAPYAVPLFAEVLEKYGKYIGGAVFFGMYWVVLADKRALVKEFAMQYKAENLKKVE